MIGREGGGVCREINRNEEDMVNEERYDKRGDKVGKKF